MTTPFNHILGILIVSGDATTEEVRRLITCTFHGAGNTNLSHGELTRLWSLEFHWFSPVDALSVLEKMLDSGWLVDSVEGVVPLEGLEISLPPLGWSPILHQLMNSPGPSKRSQSMSEGAEKSPSVMVISESDNSGKYPPDWAEGSIPILISIISEKSGLEGKEVVRRAQRKRRSLGNVTLWMSLALVAREQGLDMSIIDSAIGAN
ncbi:MAG: hypothetical protein CMB46_01145 [Euryarchaeota archaeon]|jgi:hypothetical protein|nr:hypothetical protein [Euryarchaeota archaeon]